MLRKMGLIILVTMISLSICACQKDEADSTVIIAGNYDSKLAELFPTAEGTKWEYYGTGDYAQHMTLDKVYEVNSQKVLKIKGEVDDLSGGDSNLDYGLEVTYSIESDRVKQSKISDVMMDSEYDQLTLIMSPLVVGTTWSEETVDSQGKKIKVQGEIIEIEEADEGTIYKVLYTESHSDYSEVRKIQKGKGVIDFIKTLKYQDQTLEISYHLYRLLPPDEKKEVVVDPAEVNKIKGVIFKYDELWIDFVNHGDTGIMDYVASGSAVESMISNYVRDQTRQKYLSIEVGEVIISGNQAKAKVYEKIQQDRDSVSEIFEYNWEYTLIKIGEQWYLQSYEPIAKP